MSRRLAVQAPWDDLPWSHLHMWGHSLPPPGDSQENNILEHHLLGFQSFTVARDPACPPGHFVDGREQQKPSLRHTKHIFLSVHWGFKVGLLDVRAGI